MGRTTDKDMNKVIRALKRKGWTVLEEGKHPKMVSPDGKVKFPFSATPSDCYAANQMIREAIRMGALTKKDKI